MWSDDYVPTEGLSEMDMLVEWRMHFVKKCIPLFVEYAMSNENFSASVLFGDELGASDWSPEKAIECLFEYANSGWDTPQEMDERMHHAALRMIERMKDE